MGKMTDADKAEMRDYRKQKDYFGYEDYSPSGRVALKTYNEVNYAQGYRDEKRRKGAGPYSPSAAKKAQEAQREYNAELRRETKNTMDPEELARGGMVGCAPRDYGKKGKK